MERMAEDFLSSSVTGDEGNEQLQKIADDDTRVEVCRMCLDVCLDVDRLSTLRWLMAYVIVFVGKHEIPKKT